MSFKDKAELMALRIYGSGLFGTYGKGNFDLTMDELAELLLIVMQGNEEENEQVDNALIDFYNSIK